MPDGITTQQIDAMDALFRLSKAMGDDMTVGDLLAVMRLAVGGGEGMLAIHLAMASQAAWALHAERKAGHA